MNSKVWFFSFVGLFLAFLAQLRYEDQIGLPYWSSFITLIVMWVFAFLPNWGLVKFKDKED